MRKRLSSSGTALSSNQQRFVFAADFAFTTLANIADATITTTHAQTPDSYFMDDGERLTAVIRLPSNVPRERVAAADEALGLLDDDTGGGEPKLHVKVQEDGVRHAAQFRIRPSETVGALLAGYCRQRGLDVASVTLQFDGVALAPNATLADCGIEDDDIIDAVVRQ